VLKEVRIDTMHLVGNLSAHEMDELMNNQWRGNKFFMHAYKNEEPFYKVYVEPRFGTWLYTKGYYNVFINMQWEAVKQKPVLLRLLLEMGVWKVRRLDIAFDWLIPMSKQFMLRKANVKMNTFASNNNYYLYGEWNEAKAVCLRQESTPSRFRC
jgi:hypothetical protein